MADIKQVVKRHYTKNDCLIIDKIIGNNLKVARKNAGYTQSDVMRIVWGVTNSRSRISRIESGEVAIDMYLFLILVDLYGQSTDFILGRSCEPINDVKASFVNNIKLNTQKYFEPIIETMAEVVIDHIKRYDKDEYLELMAACDDLGHYTFANSIKLATENPELYKILHRLMGLSRQLRVNEAYRETQMYAQMEAIVERHDKEDGHLLMLDLMGKKQYTLPLPEPRNMVVDLVDGGE